MQRPPAHTGRSRPVSGCSWACSGDRYSGVPMNVPACGQPIGACARTERDAKIGQQDTAVHVDQDVMRLDVAMDRAARVSIMQRIGDRREQRRRSSGSPSLPRFAMTSWSVQPAMYSIAI